MVLFSWVGFCLIVACCLGLRYLTIMTVLISWLHYLIVKGFLMERVPLFFDAVDDVLADAGVNGTICSDIRAICEYIPLFYGGRCENASLDILGSDEVVVFWEDNAFSTSVVLGGFEKEARVESGETGSSLSLSSSGQLEWVLGSLGQMRRILAFDV